MAWSEGLTIEQRGIDPGDRKGSARSNYITRIKNELKKFDVNTVSELTEIKRKGKSGKDSSPQKRTQSYQRNTLKTESPVVTDISSLPYSPRTQSFDKKVNVTNNLLDSFIRGDSTCRPILLIDRCDYHSSGKPNSFYRQTFNSVIPSRIRDKVVSNEKASDLVQAREMLTDESIIAYFDLITLCYSIGFIFGTLNNIFDNPGAKEFHTLTRLRDLFHKFRDRSFKMEINNLLSKLENQFLPPDVRQAIRFLYMPTRLFRTDDSPVAWTVPYVPSQFSVQSNDLLSTILFSTSGNENRNRLSAFVKSFDQEIRKYDLLQNVFKATFDKWRIGKVTTSNCVGEYSPMYLNMWINRPSVRIRDGKFSHHYHDASTSPETISMLLHGNSELTNGVILHSIIPFPMSTPSISGISDAFPGLLNVALDKVNVKSIPNFGNGVITFDQNLEPYVISDTLMLSQIMKRFTCEVPSELLSDQGQPKSELANSKLIYQTRMLPDCYIYQLSTETVKRLTEEYIYEVWKTV